MAARRYKGDDLAGLDKHTQWDFDPAAYDAVDYSKVTGLNPTSATTLAALKAKYTEAQLAPYFTVTTDAAGNWTSVKLTAEGAARARALDKSAYTQVVGGKKIGPGNPVDDWMSTSRSRPRTRSSACSAGGQESGSVPLVDTFAASGTNGMLWTPEHLAIYMKNFARYLDDKLSMQLSTQSNQHSLDGTDSDNVFLQNYQLGNLQVGDLVAGTPPRWSPQYNYRANSRLRSELNLFYQHSETMNIVGGVEARYSSIGANNITSATAPADETGAAPTGVLGGNQIRAATSARMPRDVARAPSLKLVAGGRVDNKQDSPERRLTGPSSIRASPPSIRDRRRSSR